MKKRNIRAVIIEWFPKRRKFLARARDFGIILVPEDPSDYISTICDNTGRAEKSLGQCFVMDIVEDVDPEIKLVAWTAKKIGKRLPDYFSAVEVIGGNPATLRIKEVPAMVLNYRSHGEVGFLYSEHLGRICMYHHGQTTQGYDTQRIRPLDMVKVGVTPLAHSSMHVDVGWRAESVMKYPCGVKQPFPESVRKFETNKVLNFMNGHGFLQVDQLGGRVFFCYGDCAGAVNGNEGMITLLKGAKSFTVYAAPTFYGKATDQYQSLYVKPVFPQAKVETVEMNVNASGVPSAPGMVSLWNRGYAPVPIGLRQAPKPPEISTRVVQRRVPDLRTPAPPHPDLHAFAPLPLHYTRWDPDDSRKMGGTHQMLSSPGIPESPTAEDDIDWQELEEELNAIVTSDESRSPQVSRTNADAKSPAIPVPAPFSLGNSAKASPLDFQNPHRESFTPDFHSSPSDYGHSISSIPSTTTRSRMSEKDVFIKNLVDDDEVIQAISKLRPDLISQLIKIVKNWD